MRADWTYKRRQKWAFLRTETTRQILFSVEVAVGWVARSAKTAVGSRHATI